MNRHTESLLQELCAALVDLGLASDAEDIARFTAQLGSESALERRAAAKHIYDRCHVKWYGDLNLPIQRAGDYPVYVFLDELRKAVHSEAP